MKCTIESIRNIELKNKRFGSRVESFLTIDKELISKNVLTWIKSYEGVKVVVYADGLWITSWAESKCSDQDEYDLLLGAHLAETKAKAKLYRFLRNFSEQMANVYATISDYFQEGYLKYDHCVAHEVDHATYLTNG